MRLNRWFILAVRIIIGGIFIYAAIDKIIHPEAFARIIHNYRLFPPSLINLIAIFTPWIEIVTGICLIIGFKYKGANLIILGMLIAFIAALTTSYIRGININCGCFSTAAGAKSDMLVRIVEDVLMAVGCVLIALLKSRRHEYY